MTVQGQKTTFDTVMTGYGDTDMLWACGCGLNLG